jgi:mono/diheme cytochrome c family protein
MIRASALLLFVVPGLFILSFTGSYQQEQGSWEAPSWADTLINPYLVEPLTLPQGQEIFILYCASCHGEHGDAEGSATKSLKIKPLRFQDERVTALSDGALFWKIREGRGEMPSFNTTLSEEQKWQMVEYIRDLSKPFDQQLNPFKSAKN